ncbi:hypothetical protein [Streptomyces sp. MBT62]|uniref:hypothetical protein n=1 Tax=Streptomyces sp. MBT62 TaxID=2800410 RepID=UPI00190DCD97|nr:hypothetical protein [Streptomyces sp. MBT62]MBK3566210.1 hypothetical protein [Streptomyces sp. MBT62]
MPVGFVVEILIVALIGWLVWTLVRSGSRRARSRREPGAGPVAPLRSGPVYRTPAASSPTGDEGRRPRLTVAAEIAGILGLFVALIALVTSR